MSAPLAGLRIGLLTASASRAGGGVFEAVAGQAALIRSLGGEAPVFALADDHGAADAHRFAGSALSHLPVVGPRQIGFAPGLVTALVAARLDLLHLHGIWMYPSAAGAAWARRTGRPYIVSPHGMLDRWIVARGRAKKAVATMAYERASWRAAHCLHALTDAEARDIVRECGRHDSVVIPNAGPRPLPKPSDDPRAPVILYLGRIHPKKNLSALVAAWRSIGDTVRASGARLVIAGWGDDAHVADLRALLGERPHDGIDFVGPRYGDDKARALASARFAVLPSLSEGLPMAMLEAWAAGTPTIMTPACNLPEGFATGAALQCETAPADIAPVLAQALAMPLDGWATHSKAAQALAAGPFAPATIAARWAATYSAMTTARAAA